jgi:hypothetical protein
MTKDLVWILWVDSAGPVDAVWHQASDLTNTLYRILSLGAIVAIDETAVTLAASFNGEAVRTDDEQLGGIITIPRCAILDSGHLQMGAGRANLDRTSGEGGLRAATRRQKGRKR